MKSFLVELARMTGKAAHHGQVRKFEDGDYFQHPTRVAEMMAARPDATEVTVAAAFLHDTLEDTKLTLAEIEALCGSQVSELVWWMTSSTLALKGHAPRAERKRMDLEHWVRAPLPAKILKMLDRLDNLRGMLKNPKPEFRVMYGQESLELLEVLDVADPELGREVKAAAEALIESGKD